MPAYCVLTGIRVVLTSLCCLPWTLPWPWPVGRHFPSLRAPGSSTHMPGRAQRAGGGGGGGGCRWGTLLAMLCCA
jgi:hypothetical protein